MLNDVNEEGDDTKRNEQRNMSLSEHEEFLHPNMMGSEDDQSQIAISVMAKDEKKKMKEIENRLDKMSDENDKLKKIVAEKELELAILRELRDKVNPRQPSKFELHQSG